MDTTLWIIAAVVIALVVCRYRREIVLTGKGWGVKATLRARGEQPVVVKDLSERSVRIGQDAKNTRIITGDAALGKRAGAVGVRSVSVGRDADGSTIVTGDGNKTD
jgi:hypothetical protein